MSTKFQKFTERIINQIDANYEEKADLQEELTIHLELSCADFMKSGYNKKEAEEKAMKSFGNANDVGNDIQQAMFPFRKAMLLTLAIASFLYSFTVYLAQLFVNGDAHSIWLVLSVIISSFILLFALQVLPSLDRKSWLNGALIFHIGIYLIGVGLALEPFMMILVGLIIMLAITLIYRTAMYTYQSDNKQITKQMKGLHFLNISAGIAVISMTLFFLWGIYAFGGPDVFPFLIIVPAFIWLIAYYAQMHWLSKNKKKIAYALAVIPAILLLAVFGFLFQVFFIV